MLRRSPQLTPALLAANRANALKSTGPRTARGKQRSAANAFRNGRRTSPKTWLRSLSLSELAEFLAFRAALDRATLAGEENQQALARTVCRVWAVKRQIERKFRDLERSARLRFLARLTNPPRCWHQTIPRPDWKVTISVVLRRGRCPGLNPGQALGRKLLRLQAHIFPKITCTGHPWYDCGGQGAPLRTKPDHRRASIADRRSLFDGVGEFDASGLGSQELRTNPECLTSEKRSENVSPIADSKASPATASRVSCHPNLTVSQSQPNDPAGGKAG
jgi:hypothetical protein